MATLTTRVGPDFGVGQSSVARRRSARGEQRLSRRESAFNQRDGPYSPFCVRSPDPEVFGMHQGSVSGFKSRTSEGAAGRSAGSVYLVSPRPKTTYGPEPEDLIGADPMAGGISSGWGCLIGESPLCRCACRSYGCAAAKGGQ